MRDIALLIQKHDADLRHELRRSRSGLFRKESGEIYVRSNVPLGNKYSDEVIGIFADEADLDFYYKIYLNRP